MMNDDDVSLFYTAMAVLIFFAFSGGIGFALWAFCSIVIDLATPKSLRDELRRGHKK